MSSVIGADDTDDMSFTPIRFDSTSHFLRCPILLHHLFSYFYRVILVVSIKIDEGTKNSYGNDLFNCNVPR